MNFETLKTKLEAHPFFPSLLSVSDFLTEFGIENTTFQIDKEQYNSTKLPFPFIAYFPDNEGAFLLVQEIRDGQVSVSGKTLQNVNIDENDFLKFWTGIALYAEANEISGEQNFRPNKIKYMLKQSILPCCVIFALTICTLIFSLRDFFWPHLILLIFKIIGIVISILLLIQSINAESAIIKRICGVGKNRNCNSLITSKAAKITSWLNWSEIGFFYFLGSFFLFLIFPASIVILFWLNLLALPFTLFSLTYQYKKKTWCILCCIVQALIWSEFILLETTRYLNPHNFKFWKHDIFYYSPCFIAPVLLWSLLKPLLVKTALLKSIQRQLNHFKYNSDLFDQILKQKSFHIVNNDLFPVPIGIPDAEIEITIISNPFCGPCKEIHPFVMELLSFRNNIQVNIIFATNDEEDDQPTKVARHMIALNLSDDKSHAKKALDDWYTNNYNNYENWATKYPVTITDQVKKASAHQKKWCKTSEIDFTPTILINGYKLPEPYVFEDIKYLID